MVDLLLILLLVQTWRSISKSSPHTESKVFTIGRSLPNVDLGIGKRLSCLGASHLALHEGHLSIRRGIESNGGAVFTDGRIGAPERSENGGRGGRRARLGRSTHSNIIHQTMIQS